MSVASESYYSSKGITSKTPPLPLHLDPNMLGYQKSSRTPQLHRVGGGDQIKTAPSVASQEFKHPKESLRDSSKKSCNQTKMFSSSISKLDGFVANPSSKKRQRSDVLSSDRPGVNLEKMRGKLHGRTHDLRNQRMEQKPENAGSVKRPRTSMADGQADNKLTTVPRHTINETKEEKFPVYNAVPIKKEEKVCRVPAGGDGREKTIKRKQSVTAVADRVVNGHVDPKQARDSKVSAGSKLGLSNIPGLRLKHSSGVGGMNILKHRVDSSSPDASTVVRNDQEAVSFSRDHANMPGQRVLLKENKSNSQEGELRTGTIMVPDSSTNLGASRGAFRDREQPPNANEITAGNIATKKIQAILQPIAKWGRHGLRKQRLRRAKLLSSFTDYLEIGNSSQGFATPGPGRRGSVVSNDASLHAGASNINALKVRKELQKVASIASVPESEEVGAFDNGPKEKEVDGCGVLATTSHDASVSALQAKNKSPSCEIGDGVKRQEKIGRTLLERPNGPPMRDKLDDLAPKPPDSARPGSERSKSKSDGPTMKKLKDRRGLPRLGSVLDSCSPELMGEMDDHETVVAANNSTRNALNQALSGGRLKDVFEDKDDTDRRQRNTLAQEAARMGLLCDKFDIGRPHKFPPMFERVAFALIDDESEEVHHQSEGENLSLHESDDSHCDPCSQMDVDSKEKDRVESEIESAVEQNRKACLLDRLLCNKGRESSTFRNSGMSTYGYSNNHSFGDDEYSHLEMGLESKIFSGDKRDLQQKELSVAGFTFPDEQGQLMSLDERVMMELQSIGLCPEKLPDLAEEEELTSDDITELKRRLNHKVTRNQRRMEELDKAILSGQETDRRTAEETVTNTNVEMAGKRQKAFRGTNTKKTSARIVLDQVASDVARCKESREKVSEPRDAKPVDCLVGSEAANNTLNEAANNTLNEAFKHQAEAKGSGAISSNPEAFGSRGSDIVDVSSEQASDIPVPSKVTSAFDIQRTDTPECNTRAKAKLKRKGRSRGSGSVTRSSAQPVEAAAATNMLQPHSNKEAEGEAVDLVKLALEGNHDQDPGSLLNIDLDGLQDCYTAGLEVPPWDDFPGLMIL